LLPTFSPDLIQKFLIAKDSSQLKKALGMITLISIPFSGAFYLIAYKMKATFHSLPANEVLLHFITILPPILKGLMVAGLLAIIMSMAEANINSTSIILVNDILKVLYPNLSHIKQLICLRMATLTLSISSLVLINLNNNILGLIWLVANFWNPIIVIPALSGFLGFRTNSKSFIISVIIAMVFTIIGRLLTGEFAITSVGLGIIGSTIGLFAAHYWQVKKGLIQPVEKFNKRFNLYFWLSQKFLKLIKQPLHLILYVLNTLNIKEEHHKLKIREFCTFTLSYYFIFSLNATSGPGQVVFAYLISTGYALCLLFLFREFVFTKKFLNKYLHLYWHFLLTFCLPLVSSYILLAGKGDMFWGISSIFSALMLYIFTDSKRFLILYSIGLVMAYALVEYTHTNPLDGISNISSASYIYLSFMFITLFLFRRAEDQVKAKTVHDKIAMMEVFGGAMAHEIKSPLATMAMYTQHIQALASKIAKENYTHEHKQLIEETKILNGVAMQGIKTVENLLMSMKKSVVAEDKKVCKIEDCINAALEEYELLNYPRDIVSVKIVNNFKFYGSPTYMKHVLLNLLSNAYKYGGRNIEIKITAKGNKLYFRDNGRGIPKESLHLIFEKFYTSSVSGTGIGLPFCKMVMEDMGGDIECKSELGKYTHFTLHFPKVKRRTTIE
jgi:signal transduction histidine kinase